MCEFNKHIKGFLHVGQMIFECCQEWIWRKNEHRRNREKEWDKIKYEYCIRKYCKIKQNRIEK